MEDRSYILPFERHAPDIELGEVWYKSLGHCEISLLNTWIFAANGTIVRLINYTFYDSSPLEHGHNLQI